MARWGYRRRYRPVYATPSAPIITGQLPFEEIRFESWGDYLAHVSQAPTTSPRKMSIDNAYSFTETASYEEAMKMANEGWASAEADARKLSNAIMRRVGSIVERDEELFDVEGQGIDIGLFNSGLPEHWVRYEQHFQESPGPIIRIVYNAAASGGISTRTLVAKGAAVAGLIECIELSGKSVELWMAIVFSVGYETVEFRAKVKEAGQPLDMGRVMFALAHPSSLRRLGFRVLELSKHPDWTTVNYGFPADVATDRDRGDIYIPKSYFGEPQWTDEETTIKWVIEQLRAQNITVNDQTV